jgi:hypothetical protein
VNEVLCLVIKRNEICFSSRGQHHRKKRGGGGGGEVLVRLNLKRKVWRKGKGNMTLLHAHHFSGSIIIMVNVHEAPLGEWQLNVSLLKLWMDITTFTYKNAPYYTPRLGQIPIQFVILPTIHPLGAPRPPTPTW